MNSKHSSPAKISRSVAASPRRSPATTFRQAIEQAEGEGVSRQDMVLRLTLSDVSLLKRDGNLAVSDISFAAGVMRYLGVAVEQGGVASSELVLPSAAG